MAGPAVLTIGLQTVRAEFNDVFPDRLKDSDGWIGDLAHQNEAASGHNADITGRAEYRDGDALNEVRAIDVDNRLRPGSPIDWMERVVQYLVGRARRGIWIPFEYIIYNRRIWSTGSNWAEREYVGSNPHDKHAHFSGRYSAAGDSWRGSLGLATLTGGDMLDQADKDWILGNVPQAVASKFGLDLATPASGVYKGIVRRTTEGTAAGFASVVQAISALDNVDEVALADALAEPLAAAVLAGLPEGTGEALTQEQVKEAVKAAFREGSGQGQS